MCRWSAERTRMCACVCVFVMDVIVLTVCACVRACVLSSWDLSYLHLIMRRRDPIWAPQQKKKKKKKKRRRRRRSSSHHHLNQTSCALLLKGRHLRERERERQREREREREEERVFFSFPCRSHANTAAAWRFLWQLIPRNDTLQPVDSAGARLVATGRSRAIWDALASPSSRACVPLLPPSSSSSSSSSSSPLLPSWLPRSVLGVFRLTPQPVSRYSVYEWHWHGGNTVSESQNQAKEKSLSAGRPPDHHRVRGRVRLQGARVPLPELQPEAGADLHPQSPGRAHLHVLDAGRGGVAVRPQPHHLQGVPPGALCHLRVPLHRN